MAEHIDVSGMIESPRNPAVRTFKECAAGKLPGLVALEGARLVADAIRAGVRVQALYLTREAQETSAGAETAATARERGIHVVRVSAAVADRMADTQTTQGVFALAQWSPGRAEELLDGSTREGGREASLIVLLDGVADPGNVGTIVRTAAALGACGVIAGPKCANITSPKVLRASMGAVFRVPIGICDDVAVFLDHAHASEYAVVVSCVDGGRPAHRIKLPLPSGPKGTVLVIGSEAEGISQASRSRADAAAMIPMARKVESLNAASAAAILIYELAKKTADRDV